MAFQRPTAAIGAQSAGLNRRDTAGISLWPLCEPRRRDLSTPSPAALAFQRCVCRGPRREMKIKRYLSLGGSQLTPARGEMAFFKLVALLVGTAVSTMLLGAVTGLGCRLQRFAGDDITGVGKNLLISITDY